VVQDAIVVDSPQLPSGLAIKVLGPEISQTIMHRALTTGKRYLIFGAISRNGSACALPLQISANENELVVDAAVLSEQTSLPKIDEPRKPFFLALMRELALSDGQKAQELHDRFLEPPDYDRAQALLGDIGSNKGTEIANRKRMELRDFIVNGGVRRVRPMTSEMLESAKSARPLTRVLMLGLLAKWKVEGAQQSFLDSLSAVKSDTTVEATLSEKDFDLTYHPVPLIRGKDWEPNDDALLDLATSASVPSVQRIVLSAVRQLRSEDNLKRCASLLLKSNTRLRATVINKLAEACQEPSKNVTLSEDDDGYETQVGALAQYWQQRFGISGS
jgi:hypothetical protein